MVERLSLVGSGNAPLAIGHDCPAFPWVIRYHSIYLKTTVWCDFAMAGGAGITGKEGNP
jgi:hypothetical protein